MKAPVGLGVGHQTRAVRVLLLGALEIALAVVAEVVVVDEVTPGVVRRVDIDQLHLVQVGLLEQLQRVQVVALDEEVAGGVEVDALLATGPQGLGYGGGGGEQGGALAGPVELVALAGAVDDVVRELLAQPVEVDGALGPPLRVAYLRDAVREQLRDAGDVGVGEVRAVQLELVHGGSVFLSARVVGV